MFGWNTVTIAVTMTVLLEVRNLTKVFSLGPGANLVAVRNASLTVDRGETLGLVGESGSGKTTLGRCILRLVEPTDGSVFLNGDKIAGLKGKALRELRSRMQLVFQDPFASLNPRLTVAQTLREPLLLQGIDRSQRKARTAEILRQVGLDESISDCYPLDLTASEQQRVGIRARAGDTTRARRARRADLDARSVGTRRPLRAPAARPARDRHRLRLYFA